MKKVFTSFFISLLVGAPAFAQTALLPASMPAQDIAAPASRSQEQCINVMAGFPSANQSARYQFFRLTKKLSSGATPAFRAAMGKYSSGKVTKDTPVVEIIEGIANPVLRQAEPSLVIGQAAYLIDFAQTCSTSINGQIRSLHAYDIDLKNAEFNAAIDQDALFLRQILSDALYSQNAHNDLVHGAAVKTYARSLITTRDHIEFTAYNTEIEDIEALYMGDLDKRLARSNDIINGEMDREVLGDAIALSDDMNETQKKQEKRRTLQTLINILNGYGL